MQLSNKLSAFSLIELSIIIAVFSVLMTGVLTQYTTGSQKKSVGSTFNRMITVDAALKYYLANKGHLPCPASLTDIKEASTPTVISTYARATDCTAPAPAGIFDKRGVNNIDDNANGDIRIGMVPVRTLGLSDSYAFDDWGRRYTYIVPKQLAVDKTEFDAFAPATTRQLTIEVDPTTDEYDVLTSGDAIYGDQAGEDIAYVLISHGATGAGGFNGNGIEATPSCNVPNHIDDILRNEGRDNENCDHSGKKETANDNMQNMHYLDVAINDSVDFNNDAFFDDYVYWLPYDTAKNIYDAANPSTGGSSGQNNQ